MRFVLFYEHAEDYNYFTGEIAKELTGRGHEVFIHDLVNPSRPSYSMQEFMAFCERKVDAVICFNRAGIHNDTFINLWDMMDACALHVLVDRCGCILPWKSILANISSSAVMRST